MSHAVKAQYLHDPYGLLGLVHRIEQTPEGTFQGSQPFPHIVMDDALDADIVYGLHRTVCSRPEGTWDKTNDQVEVKWRSNWQSEYDIPEPARELVRFFNSGMFLRELSRLTGIPKLIADPYYTGGGFNMLRKGGLLDVHVDGNWHEAMGVHRRLNLILYLNPSWRKEWGGALGFYNETGEKLVTDYAPIGNRLVLFETHDKTYHGHPEPITCPDGEARTSIILYYYTAAARPSEQVTVEAPHRALWRSKGFHDKAGNLAKV